MSAKESRSQQKEVVVPGIVRSKYFYLHFSFLFRSEKGSIVPGTHSSEGSSETSRETKSSSDHSEGEGSTKFCILSNNL